MHATAELGSWDLAGQEWLTPEGKEFTETPALETKPHGQQPNF